MGLFEGLKGYEIILAGLGILLFLVQLFILVYYVLHNRSLKYVLPSLIIPIVMIGFPAIKKVQFGNSMLEMRETIAALEENPEDTETLAQLEERLEQLRDYENLQPTTLMTMAEAHVTLGDTAAAITQLDAAIKQARKMSIPQKKELELVRARTRPRRGP